MSRVQSTSICLSSPVVFVFRGSDSYSYSLGLPRPRLPKFYGGSVQCVSLTLAAGPGAVSVVRVSRPKSTRAGTSESGPAGRPCSEAGLSGTPRIGAGVEDATGRPELRRPAWTAIAGIQDALLIEHAGCQDGDSDHQDIGPLFSLFSLKGQAPRRRANSGKGTFASGLSGLGAPPWFSSTSAASRASHGKGQAKRHRRPETMAVS